MHLSSFNSFLICICENVDIPSFWSCAPCRIVCFYGCTSWQPVLAQIVASFLPPSKISRNLDAFQVSRIEDLAFKKTSGCQTLTSAVTRYLSKSSLFCLRACSRSTSLNNGSDCKRIVYATALRLNRFTASERDRLSILASPVANYLLPTFLDVPYSQIASSLHGISMRHLSTQLYKDKASSTSR